MTHTTMTIMVAFMFSLLGTFMFQSHLVSTLLCLEGMMLSLFIMTTITAQSMNTYTILIVILAFTACEAADGLAWLVMVSNTYSTDYV